MVSGIASFTTAFLLDGALWISDGKDIHDKSSAIYRKKVTVRQALEHAYFVVASAGLHEVSINDLKVGNHCLDPMFTRFDKRVLSVTHDVTSTLHEGENELCVQLGNGWYNHQSVAVWNYDKASWRRRPCFCGKLILEYKNGEREEIRTDESWISSVSPVILIAFIQRNIMTLVWNGILWTLVQLSLLLHRQNRFVRRWSIPSELRILFIVLH